MLNRRRIWLVAGTLAFAAAASLFHGRWIPGPAAAAAPQGAAPQNAVPVSVVAAARRDMPLYLFGIGNVQAFNTVTIRTQVDGQIQKIAFREGQDVKPGDVLVQIDPRTYQAALDQAMAKKAQDQAQLANARLDVQRYASLVEKNYIARQQLDTARAQVGTLEAAVQGDEASIENARVTLGYTTIRSPIEGRVGIRQVDVGNIVHPADASGIVVITQLHPISLIFTLPEDTVDRVTEAMATGPLTVTALSRDNSRQLDDGRLELVDNQIDIATGTVHLKATMPNRHDTLWPGQFINARLHLGTLHDAVTIPGSAIQHGAQGEYAYVVRPDNTAEVRNLKVGPVIEGSVVIEDGIKEGEMVVTSGQFRLQPGSRVEARTASAAPPAPAASRE